MTVSETHPTTSLCERRHLKKIRANGIEIYEYKPLKFPWVHAVFNRDHRKIVVIDGQIAYTGGMNVADYYIKGTKVVGEWHDMHCRIDGSEVNTLQKIFLKMWNKVSGQHIDGEEYYLQGEARLPGRESQTRYHSHGLSQDGGHHQP